MLKGIAYAAFPRRGCRLLFAPDRCVPALAVARCRAGPACRCARRRAARRPLLEAARRSKRPRPARRAARRSGSPAPTRTRTARSRPRNLLAARRKAFAKLDTNGNGTLSFEEWAAKTIDKFKGADGPQRLADRGRICDDRAAAAQEEACGCRSAQPDVTALSAIAYGTSGDDGFDVADVYEPRAARSRSSRP